MAISVNPTLPVIAAQGAGSATSGVVLQPGTVISAQVQNVLADNLVQIAIAGLSFEVLSEVALTPGQNLQLAVSQNPDGVVRLQVVAQGNAAASGNAATLAPSAPVGPAANVAAPGDPLTPLERIAVSVASEAAATQQQSLAPLFANLAAASSSNLPPALQQAVAQVLAQQTSLDENLSGGDIQSAFQSSGLFLEASLASGTVASTGSAPDLKAALIVLQQALTSAVETVESPTPLVSATAGASASTTKPALDSPSLAPSQVVEVDGHEIQLPQATLADAAAGDPAKLVLAQALFSGGAKLVTTGAALNLLQEALQEIPHAANATAIITSPDGKTAQGNPATTPPPPFRGALPSAQPIANPSLASGQPLATTVHHLLDDTDAALARQTLLQVASLPDRADPNGNRIDPSIPRWNFEIPFGTPQGTAMAQFEISRDGGGNEVEAAKRTWQARFSLNVEPAGPVHALVSLTGDRTSVRMWAERPQTAAQLRAGATELSQALSQAELTPGDIVIREGAPPQVAPAKAGHFLDRAL